MKIKRMITVSATALALAGLGTFVNNTNKASASQPVRVFRQTNGYNNHGYYGFYYAKNMEDMGSKIHYQKGLLPRNLRKRNRYVSIWDPAVKAESPTIKKGRSRYYIDDLDTSQRLSHGKYYQNVLINTNDVHGISNRQDRSLLKSIKSQYKRNQRVIKRHRRNHKLVDRLEDRNSFLQIKLNTDNTNNRMRIDPKRKRKALVKRHARRHYRKARKHYAKRNVKHNKAHRHNRRRVHKNNKASTNYDNSDSIQHNLPKFRSETLSLINKDRADSTGKAPLQESSALDKIAQIRAKQASTPAQMNQSDPHMDPATNNSYYEEVSSKLGYNVDAIGQDNMGASGENLAWGDYTPKDFNDAWYTSEKASDGGHYQNIVGNTSTTSHFNLVGIGVYHDTGVEVFADDVSSNNVNNNSSNSINDSNSNNSSAESDNNTESEAQARANNDARNAQIEAQTKKENAYYVRKDYEGLVKGDKDDYNEHEHDTYLTNADKQRALNNDMNHINQDEAKVQEYTQIFNSLS